MKISASNNPAIIILTILFVISCENGSLRPGADRQANFDPGAAPGTDIRSFARPEADEAFAIFVDPVTGQNSAIAGTRSIPLASLQWATDRAAAAGKAVIVAGGAGRIYNSTWAKSDIYCGYNPGDWTHDPASFPSEIVGDKKFALSVDDSRNLRIDSCVISGGSGFTRTFGLRARGTVLLTDNIIDGGAGDSITYGILAGDSVGCSLTAINNIIKSGSPTSGNATGVVNQHCQLKLINNTIIADGGSDHSIGFNSWSAATSSLLVNNIFDSGASLSENWAVSVDSPSRVQLAANLLVGEGAAPDARLLNHNTGVFTRINDEATINNCSLWADFCDTDSWANATTTTAGFTNSIAGDYSIATTSPAVNIGIDPTPYYGGVEIASDRESVYRPLGGARDAGAYERKLLPDSGQTGCYDEAVLISCPAPGETYYGQDGQYEGRPPLYLTSSTETVFDLNTGLTWQKEDDNITRSQTDASSYCSSLSLDGYSDWRLPTMGELHTIADYDVYYPSIDSSAFPGTENGYSWSSEVYTFNPAQYYSFSFGMGTSTTGHYSLSSPVRCVRGQSPIGTFSGDYTVLSGGVAVDNSTGLMWQVLEYNSTKTWATALDYCENLSLGGYNDWRLPNIKELYTLVDLGAFNPAVDSSTFGAISGAPYWSSTSNANYEDDAWTVDFFNGKIWYILKSSYIFAFCVR